MNEISRPAHKCLMVGYGFIIYSAIYGIKMPPDMEAKTDPANNRFYLFLTNWNLMLQFLFFTLSSITDLSRPMFSDRRQKGWLISLVDFLFGSIVFSTSMLVCITFWGLFHIDRELIFPVRFDEFFPNWLNHGMHSLPFFAVMFELLTVKRRLPKPAFAVVAATVFSFSYFALTMYVAHTTDHWVYPVLRNMGYLGRFSFIGVCHLLLMGFLKLGYGLHRLRWGAKTSEKKESSQTDVSAKKKKKK